MKKIIQKLQRYCNRTYRRPHDRMVFMDAVKRTIDELNKDRETDKPGADKEV